MTLASFDWIIVVDEAAALEAAEPPAGETVLGLEVPESYRAFLGRFGYGLFGGLLHLFPWSPGHCDHLPRRAAGLREMFRETLALDIAELDPDGTPEALLSCVPFGISINGDTICWSPTFRVAGEPEVVVVSSKVLAYKRTGRDFGAFLRSLTEPAGARVLMGPAAQPLPPTFVPSTYLSAWRRTRHLGGA